MYAPAGPGAQGSQPAYDTLRHLMGYAGPGSGLQVSWPTPRWASTTKWRYLRQRQLRPFQEGGREPDGGLLPVHRRPRPVPAGGAMDYSFIYNDVLTLQQGLRYKGCRAGRIRPGPEPLGIQPQQHLQRTGLQPEPGPGQSDWPEHRHHGDGAGRGGPELGQAVQLGAVQAGQRVGRLQPAHRPSTAPKPASLPPGTWHRAPP